LPSGPSRSTSIQTGDRAALADYLVRCYGNLDEPDHELGARLAFELGSVERLRDRTLYQDMHRHQVAVVAAWCVEHGRPERDAQQIARDAVLTARGIQWGYLLDRDVDAAAAALDRLARRLADEADRTDS